MANLRVVVPLPSGAIDLKTHWTEWHASKFPRADESQLQELLAICRKEKISISGTELERYKLADPVLAEQLASMKSYFTSPINLARSTTVVTEGTFDGYVKTLREFLGFLRKYEEMRKLNVLACFDGPKLIRYISYRWGAVGNKASTLSNVLFHIKAVLRWGISGMGGDTGSERAAADDFYQGVDALVKQVKETAPAKQDVSLEELEAEGHWLDWADLRAGVEAYAMVVLQRVCALRKARGGGVMPSRMASAEAIDIAACLITAAFGIVFCGGIHAGTPRPFLLKSLVVKGASGCCPPADGTSHCSVCVQPNTCRGNVIERSTKNRDDFVLAITHHKMVNRSKQVIPPIVLRKDEDPWACAILEELFTWGHSTHVESYADGSTDEMTSSDHHLRLFRKSMGGGVFRVQDHYENAASMYVTKFVSDLMGKSRSELRLTANCLRRMFVTWMRENNFTPAEEEGCAIVMGTSRRMFDQVYEMARRQRLGAQARARTRQLLDAAKVRLPNDNVTNPRSYGGLL